MPVKGPEHMTLPLTCSNGFRLDVCEAAKEQHKVHRSSGVLTQSASDAFSFGYSPFGQVEDLLSHNVFQGASSIGAFHRELIGREGYRQIADWTHSLSKSSTDLAMDAFKGGPFHRWVGHHPVDLARMWLDGKVEVLPALRHLSLDVITTNGLPTLPESVHTALRDIGVPYQTLVEWTHINAFDVAVGCISMADGAYSLTIALTGHLDWGTQTFVFTFGQGTVEIIAGCMTQNPLLVAGGVMHVASGSLSAWEHWSTQDPTMFDHIFSTLEAAGFGMGLSTALRLGFVWNQTTVSERAGIAAESSAISAAACFISQLSASLVPLASVCYSFGRMAWQLADSDSEYWSGQNFSSRLTYDLAIAEMLRSGGEDSLERFKKFLSDQRHYNAVLAPQFLNSHDWLLKPQPETEHVLAKHASWQTHAADPREEALPSESDKNIIGPPPEAEIAFKPFHLPKQPPPP